MKITNCPSCGANVPFNSAASVMAVCSYCHTTVLRDGTTAENIGRLSEILDDFSPIQIGTEGKWQGKSFVVRGRLRLSYEDGSWNEWSIDFDDGSQGWLSDASGQYVVTQYKPSATTPPPYEQIQVGMRLKVGAESYTVTDARVCKCIGGEGELPGLAFDGKEFPSVDLRSAGGKGFITFDYSDTPPSVYAGEACSREELSLSNLRSDEEIEAATGKLKGGVEGFYCPSCGASLEYHPGFGESIACSYCQAVIQLEGDKKTILLKQEEVAKRTPAIPVGTVGALFGKNYQVIGFMSRTDGEGSEWEEYLLFAKSGEFLWLVHSDGEWYLGEVLNVLPHEQDGNIYYNSQLFRPGNQYSATTTYVLGEFNWRVKVGDTVTVTEWNSGNSNLSRELYQNEVTWSYSRKAVSQKIAKAFGLTLPDENTGTGSIASPEEETTTVWTAVFIIGFIIFMIYLFASSGGGGYSSGYYYGGSGGGYSSGSFHK